MWTVVILALLGEVAFPASGANCTLPESAQTRSEAALREMEQIWVKALNANDAATVECILDSAFIDTSWRGVQRPRAQVLAELSARPKFAQAVVIGRVHIAGDTGVVWGTNVIRNQNGAVIARIRFTDIFHYDKGRWHAIAAQETAERK